MKRLVLSFSLVALMVAGLNLSTQAQNQLPALPRPDTAFAGSGEAVNIVLHDAFLQYTVPIGKVLVIENFIWALEGDATHQTISIVPDGDPSGVGDFLLKFSSTAPDSFTPERQIRIVGDGVSGVRILNNGAADWRDVAIFGILRDV